MFGAKPSQPNDTPLQKDELHTYLSNRRHLDFALKLALGSQAYLHEISSINQGSNMSFDSAEYQLSPIKSVDGSIGKKLQQKNKPGLNYEKQNITKVPYFRSQQKTMKPQCPEQQSRHLRHRLQSVQVWMQFISDRCKMANDIAGSRLTQKTPRGQKVLSKQGINEFFRQVVFRLQKLQIIEKQEYNAKLLICQLTEATLRQSELQQKIKVLRREVDQKKTVINQQEQIILKLLNRRKYQGEQFSTTIKKQPGPKMQPPSQSLLKYSLSENEQLNTIAKNVRFFDIGDSKGQIPEQNSNNLSNQAKNSLTPQQSRMKKSLEYQFCQSPIKMKQNMKFVYETVNYEGDQQATVPRYEASTPTVKDIRRATQKVVEFRETEKSYEKQKSEDESILLSYLSGSIKKVPGLSRKPTIEQMRQHNDGDSQDLLIDHQGFYDREDRTIQGNDFGGQQSQQMQTKSPQSYKTMSQGDKISDSAMLEIREEVQRLIGENQQLKERIDLLENQLSTYQDKQNHYQLMLKTKEQARVEREIQTDAMETTDQLWETDRVEFRDQIQQTSSFEQDKGKDWKVQQKNQSNQLQQNQTHNLSPDQQNHQQIQTQQPIQQQVHQQVCLHCQHKVNTQNYQNYSKTPHQLKHSQQQQNLQPQDEDSNLLASNSTHFHLLKQAQQAQSSSKMGDKTQVSSKLDERTIPHRYEFTSNKSQQTISDQPNQHHSTKTQHIGIQTDQTTNNTLTKNHFFKTNKEQFAQTFNHQNYQFSQSDNQSLQESNLLEDSPWKQQEPQHNFANTWSNDNSHHAFNKQQPTQKRYSTQSSPQLKQTFLLLVENNKNLLQKLKMKKSELKQIKEIIRQAKKINEEDMHKLQTAIINRQVRRSREITELKEIEFKWNNEFREARSKKTRKTQILNQQLQLKVNQKIFKFYVPKTKNTNA